MQPVVTAEEMRAIDAAAADDLDTLIERAGWAAATAARSTLATAARSTPATAARSTPASVYGSRILVLAGPGNNGADGRVAARILSSWGAKVVTVDVRSWREASIRWGDLDLVIDAGFGTGLRRPFDAPDLDELYPDGTDRPAVLAVDLPSGLDGDVGSVEGSAMRADATVTFGALKPGLVLGDGPDLVGEVTVAGLGLDASGASIHLLDGDDLEAWPARSPDAHKWNSAVWVIGGQPSMTGAPVLSATAAARAGAGYVLGSTPGSDASGLGLRIESVGRSLGFEWGREVIEQSDRVAALVLGPGLSTDERVGGEVRQVIAGVEQPLVIDAGAIDAIAVGGVPTRLGSDRASCLRGRKAPVVLTPHDGEFQRLMGAAPGPDRIRSARLAAESYHSVVLLKGPTTVVAAPDGRVLLSTAGDARLATAGTGDVLSGIIAAGLALGLEPFMAAGLGAELHGHAARRGHAVGLVAGDLPELVAEVLSSRSKRGTA